MENQIFDEKVNLLPGTSRIKSGKVHKSEASKRDDGKRIKSGNV